MSYRIGIASVVLAIAAGLIPAASAQAPAVIQQPGPLTWSNENGLFHVAVPAGWTRYDMDLHAAGLDPLLLVVAMGDVLGGKPGLLCQAEISIDSIAPGVTQEALNEQYGSTPADLGLVSAVRSKPVDGGGMELDGLMAARKKARLFSPVLRDGKFAVLTLTCSRGGGAEVTDDDLKAIRGLFDGVSITPEAAPAARPAGAAQTWTSADGGLHFAIPAGWEQLPAGSASPGVAAGKTVLAVAKADGPGGLGINCSVEITMSGAAKPGETQATMNARVKAGAETGGVTLDEIRVMTTGGTVTVDGFLSMQPRIMIAMNTIYFHGGKFYMAETKCGRTRPPGTLTMNELTLARTFFDTVSVTP
jgi:hypothetical protein